MPEVLRSDLKSENSFDHRLEVCQRPNRTERRRIGRSRRAARRSEYPTPSQLWSEARPVHEAPLQTDDPHGALHPQCPASDDTVQDSRTRRVTAAERPVSKTKDEIIREAERILEALLYSSKDH
jgi:hypothetical protein